MNPRTTSLDEFLGALLRGAAKLLGCGSTNLILINEKTQEIRIRLGTMADSYPTVAQLELALGRSLSEVAISVRKAQGSMVYRAWRERTVLETSSLSELVGSAFPQLTSNKMQRLIGEHRFICVPALSSTRNYGVLLFQKQGRHPFSRQQRVLLLRYARRIGEILESDLTGQGQHLVARLPGNGPEFMLFDRQGELLGHAPAADGKPPVDDETLQQLRALVCDPSAASGGARSLAANLSVDLYPGLLQDKECLLCTLQRQTDHAGLSLENQLLQLTLGEPAPAIFVDPQFLITSCNDSTEPFLGYSSAELLHCPISSFFCHPSEILDQLRQQILDPTAPRSQEHCLVRRKDGTIATVAVEVLLLAGDQNQAVGFLILLRPADTEPNGTERVIRQERLATMGELAAQLAHEIRNPLVAIGATLESLRRDPLLADSHRQVLGSLCNEIVRMDMTLKDYLAARHDLNFADLELHDLVEDAARLLESTSRRRGQRVLNQVPGGLCVRADYDALKRVLFNLLLNALEASPSDAEVICEAETSPHHVSLAVSDRGPGLQASSEECFQAFFTTKKNGTGLGLTVCQKIARAHGGALELRSRDGGGCRAVVSLPHPSKMGVPA